jgi:hypothetical protein
MPPGDSAASPDVLIRALDERNGNAHPKRMMLVNLASTRMACVRCAGERGRVRRLETEAFVWRGEE